MSIGALRRPDCIAYAVAVEMAEEQGVTVRHRSVSQPRVTRGSSVTSATYCLVYDAIDSIGNSRSRSPGRHYYLHQHRHVQ